MENKTVTATELAEIRDRGYGHVRDLNAKNTVTVRWNLIKTEEDMPAIANNDKIVSLIIDGKEAFVRVEELRKLLRWA